MQIRWSTRVHDSHGTCAHLTPCSISLIVNQPFDHESFPATKVGAIPALYPTIEDLREIADRKKFQGLGLNGRGTQKIVPCSEVSQHIVDGVGSWFSVSMKQKKR